ncbi:MAG: anthranilate phosphoribosyltransferase [Gammaproteobacteria bacterium]|nr:MAG: anthranilate phosphoribosyltransferase [Gammaproteobacteria bacterium]
MTNQTMQALLGQLYDGEPLQSLEIQKVFNALLAGELSEIEITAVLIALKARPHNADVFQGAAGAMLQAANPFEHDMDLVVDCCGTGGAGKGLLNISTAVSFVVAGCGVAVAKHGNRAVSSMSGSADALEHLGVKLTEDTAVLKRQLQECGLTFLFAPYFHPSIKNVMPVRNALATRTVFNILGPLVNPARPNIQLMGVFAKDLCLPVAETLAKFGVSKAMVVNGSGLDEIAVHSNTHVARLENGKITEFTLTPEQMGIEQYPIEALRGGDPEGNSNEIKALFDGQGKAAFRDAVAVNAAAVLILAGKAADFPEGVAMAKESLASGKAKKVLEKLIRIQESDHDLSA